MPRRKAPVTLPARIANYLRVIKHRITKGEILLPIILYIDSNGTKVSTMNYNGWKPLVQVRSTEDIDFEVLAYDVAVIRNESIPSAREAVPSAVFSG
jgi:hypothetical protein